jgi:hypothetical protein
MFDEIWGIQMELGPRNSNFVPYQIQLEFSTGLKSCNQDEREKYTKNIAIGKTQPEQLSYE